MPDLPWIHLEESRDVFPRLFSCGAAGTSVFIRYNIHVQERVGRNGDRFCNVSSTGVDREEFCGVRLAVRHR